MGSPKTTHRRNTSPWHSYAPVLCSVIASLSITGLVIAAIQDARYLARPLPPVPPEDLPKVAPRPAEAPLMPLARVQALALMGKAPVEPLPVEPPSIEEIPDTALNLTLAGVFASDDPNVAAAMIKVDGQAPRYVRMGQEVVPGTTLEIIAADGVTLRSDQAYEKLMFSRSGLWQEKPSVSLATLKAKEHPAQAVQESASLHPVASAPTSTTPSSAPTYGTETATAQKSESVAHLTLQERLARLRSRMPYHQ